MWRARGLLSTVLFFEGGIETSVYLYGKLWDILPTWTFVGMMGVM